jgi:hypothetical protein
MAVSSLNHDRLWAFVIAGRDAPDLKDPASEVPLIVPGPTTFDLASSLFHHAFDVSDTIAGDVGGSASIGCFVLRASVPMNGHTVMGERRRTLPAFIGLRRAAASSCVETPHGPFHQNAPRL